MFVIGGEGNPWGTFEFDLDSGKFLPEVNEYGVAFVPLNYGRSYHSLAATSGLIYCSGGIPKHFHLKDEPEDSNENLKVLEVYKLKDKMWLEYSHNLQYARYCHSSCIMGSYLYMFHGYDARDISVN